jgi:hypothetical protein
MTPQDKAWELVQKYLKYQHYLENDAWNQSKECALIAVDLVLGTFFLSVQDGVEHYWKEVKQEIEKL